MSDQEQAEATRKKTIDYFVNGEVQTSTEKELMVREILKRAGFEPPHDWILTRDKDGHEFKKPDKLVELHKGERFTATSTGPTPTS